MPVVNTWEFDLRDVNREVFFNNYTIAQNNLGLREMYAYSHSTEDYFDSNYHVYLDGINTTLRDYRNYHRIYGQYLYTIKASNDTDFINKFYNHYADPNNTYGTQYYTIAGFEGWHVPRLEELNELIEYYNGKYVAGFKLKQQNVIMSFNKWIQPNLASTNNTEERLDLMPGGVHVYANNEDLLVGMRGTYIYIDWVDGNLLNKGYDLLYKRSDVLYNIDGYPVYCEMINQFYVENNTTEVTKQQIQARNATSIRLIRDADNTETEFTDVDGNHYTTVQIGNQVWMKQDIKTAYHFLPIWNTQTQTQKMVKNRIPELHVFPILPNEIEIEYTNEILIHEYNILTKAGFRVTPFINNQDFQF